jgi:hypothetical protein
MKRAIFAETKTIQPGTHRHSSGREGCLFLVITILGVAPGIAQMGGASGGELQQKVAAVEQSLAENQQKLHQYQWTETTQLTLKGEEKPPRASMCQYGPDGTVQKTPIGASPEEPSGGRLKQKIVAKKKEEMEDYMGQVKALLAMYVPPDPQKIAQAFQAGKASLSSNPASQAVAIVFNNYAQPGDQMTLTFDTSTRKVTTLNVSTYLDDPKDVVTLAIEMSSLPDGTNYVQQTVLDATAKQLQVTTTNSNYQRL